MEIALILASVATNGFLIAFIYIREQQYQKQTRLFIDSIMSKRPEDYIALRHLDKTKQEDEPEIPIEIPLAHLSDDKFMETIVKE